MYIETIGLYSFGQDTLSILEGSKILEVRKSLDENSGYPAEAVILMVESGEYQDVAVISITKGCSLEEQELGRYLGSVGDKFYFIEKEE